MFAKWFLTVQVEIGIAAVFRIIRSRVYMVYSFVKIILSLQIPLSAKQKEAIKAQLAKEEEIRKRLSLVSIIINLEVLLPGCLTIV